MAIFWSLLVILGFTGTASGDLQSQNTPHISAKTLYLALTFPASSKNALFSPPVVGS